MYKINLETGIISHTSKQLLKNKQACLRDFLFLKLLTRNNPNELVKFRKNIQMQIVNNPKSQTKKRLKAWVNLIDEKFLGHK